MKCGAFIPPYVVATMLAAAACRTAADPPPPPAAPALPAAPAPPAATPAPPAAPTAASEAISFETMVKPLLARTCTPCHVPGGRMYERMPFDRPETLLSHRDGVLRRLKNPDDHQLMERWLAEQDKS